MSYSSQRNLKRACTVLVPVVLAAWCFWSARPQSGVASIAVPPRTIEVSSTGASQLPLATVPIETIEPGMRVLAGNPDLQGPAEPDITIDKETWRLIRLQITKSDGGGLEVTLLRPISWIIAQAAECAAALQDESFGLPRPLAVPADELPLAELTLGGQLMLDLPELGASGVADILSIEPCPEISSPTSGTRIVTGTFRHSAANVIDLSVEGERSPIGTTSNHPFWSEDRQTFVEAGQLQVGEHLLRADGLVSQVTKITPRRGPPIEVFNLEVDAEHVYSVGFGGYIVHNNCVYFSKVNGVMEYVGITKNFGARSAAHARNGRTVTQIPGASGLTRWQAREVEQALISYYGRVNQGTGTLSNKINSISPNNPQFNQAITNGMNFLNSIGWVW